MDFGCLTVSSNLSWQTSVSNLNGGKLFHPDNAYEAIFDTLAELGQAALSKIKEQPPLSVGVIIEKLNVGNNGPGISLAAMWVKIGSRRFKPSALKAHP